MTGGEAIERLRAHLAAQVGPPLDVDVPRKRIALTLRLDDETRPGGGRDNRDSGRDGAPRPPRQQRGGGGNGGNGGGDRNRGGDQRRGGNSGGSGGSNGGGSADTALADALRRAGLLK